MTQIAGTLDTFDLIGMAEDVEDDIFNISPYETPFLTRAKRGKADATNHQWQTDSLAAASSNKAVEGDDATFTTAAATTMLANRLQIFKKTVLVSDTADAVRKYGRKEEFAYQLMKRGKELKRDIEFTLVTNQSSSVGGSQTARQMAGVESMIANNRIIQSGNTTGTTPGFSGGDWAAPTDGTTSAIDETMIVAGLTAAWSAGGDPGILMMNSSQKRKMAAFGGATKFAGVTVNQGREAQAVLIGGVDLYISDFGEHKVILNRFMRTRTVLALDMDYWATAWLRPIKYVPLAKTGDATKGQLVCEMTLVGRNPDSSAKLQDLS